MRSALRSIDTERVNLADQQPVHSPRFSAFLKRLELGKKVTDEAWLEMESFQLSTMPDLDTRSILCSHPRANGQGYTAVRITTLKRIASSNHLSARFAEEELLRRGHVELPIKVTIHAIDGASNRYWKVWLNKRRQNQGIAGWLKEEAMRAYYHGIAVEGNVLVREHLGMIFCFQAKKDKSTLKLVSVN